MSYIKNRPYILPGKKNATRTLYINTFTWFK